MENLVRQLLETEFREYKQYHLYILIGFTLIIALFQVIQTLIVTNKVEKYKNDLKKSEIRFSRYNELQINALRKIYHQLATFQLANNLLFKNGTNKIGHTKFENRINEWIKNYLDCANELAREKILLPKEIKESFSKTIKDFDEIKSVLINERENLNYLEMAYSGNWNSMYEFEGNELAIITQKLNIIKEKDSIKNSDKHIRELREKIEAVFQKME
ncbi:hypothetical protein [Flavobacterium algoritolerans]|uniref:Uncharacterized protein n=1 Tax=Flavobacterium algoritolerans TaxID=3041254 RepID=A0ABT6V7V4_9FLAO|nr:hypothetical protein [Flavobacterium algoritolerans]MDI5894295.1 hypothetical protein [Flavobacterium algoritolerans]